MHCRAQTVGDGASSHKIDNFNKFWKNSNLAEHQNCIIGSKVATKFAEWGNFAYWWNCIGRGLRLQPAQQASYEETKINVSFFFMNAF